MLEQVFAFVLGIEEGLVVSVAVIVVADLPGLGLVEQPEVLVLWDSPGLGLW